ncbi:molybdopterin molybdotransferase MoeA [Helicobacter sp. 23-1048]
MRKNLNIDEVFALIWDKCAFIAKDSRTTCEEVDIFEARGRILADDIIASRALPPFDNSAMDGYAVRLADSGRVATLQGRTLAGESAQDITLQDGMCQKVMTGSPVPAGTQAIVPIEKVQITQSKESTHIALPQDILPNQHIRLQGEEIALDSVILPRYTRLKPLDLGLLASQGLRTIKVCKRLSIALFSSGDEVIEPGTKALPHQIYNTNAISLDSILSHYHHNAQYLGILPDDKSTLLTKLQNLTQYNVVITTGGASVGDADLLKSTLSELGADFLFDGVNVKPGKHLSIAILGKSIFIMLPGNPLASLLHFYTIILSILEFLSGARLCFIKAQYANADSQASLANGVQKIILGRLESGKFYIFNKGKFGSSALINVWKNNALAILNGQYDTIKPNDTLACIAFESEFEESCNFINDLRR